MLERSLPRLANALATPLGAMFFMTYTPLKKISVASCVDDRVEFRVHALFSVVCFLYLHPPLCLCKLLMPLIETGIPDFIHILELAFLFKYRVNLSGVQRGKGVTERWRRTYTGNLYRRYAPNKRNSATRQLLGESKSRIWPTDTRTNQADSP